jgi:hypothetical protein
MSSRLPMMFILLTVVIDSMGIGLIVPVPPRLIQDLEGPGLRNAALWGGVLATVLAACTTPPGRGLPGAPFLLSAVPMAGCVLPIAAQTRQKAA